MFLSSFFSRASRLIQNQNQFPNRPVHCSRPPDGTQITNPLVFFFNLFLLALLKKLKKYIERRKEKKRKEKKNLFVSSIRRQNIHGKPCILFETEGAEPVGFYVTTTGNVLQRSIVVPQILLISKALHPGSQLPYQEFSPWVTWDI